MCDKVAIPMQQQMQYNVEAVEVKSQHNALQELQVHASPLYNYEYSADAESHLFTTMWKKCARERFTVMAECG